MRLVVLTLIGVGVAAALLATALPSILPAAPAPPVWSVPMVFGGAGPGEHGSAVPTHPTNCTVLDVRYNSSGPIDVWVAPWRTASVVPPTQYRAAAGPSASGEFVVEVPYSSTGWYVLVLNPSQTVTLPTMQYEIASSAC